MTTKTSAKTVGKTAMTTTTAVTAAITGGEIAHLLPTDETTGTGTEIATGSGREIVKKVVAEMTSTPGTTGRSRIETLEGQLRAELFPIASFLVQRLFTCLQCADHPTLQLPPHDMTHLPPETTFLPVLLTGSHATHLTIVSRPKIGNSISGLCDRWV